MSGDEERVSKRARKNYPGKVSFGALSKEENEHSVAQVSRCTDTSTCAWTDDDTKPQLLGGLGEVVGGGSGLQQTAEEEFGEFYFLLGEPQVCLETSTDAAAALFEQAVSDPQKIRDKLLQLAVQLAVQLAGEYQHSAPLKRWDPKDSKANTTCGKLQAQVVADVDTEGVFKRQKEQGQKGRPDDVPYVLARSVRSNMQYQAAAEIGARGAGNMAVRGKCMERAMQMFCGKKQEGIPRAVVEALLRY